MSDLSAYANFTVQLDITNKSAPVVILTDTGTYPVGVPAGITGIFTITQPDGGIRTGSFTTPDIIYSAGALQPASIAIRLTSDSKLQCGVYVFRYELNHSSYLPTVLTKTFTLAYDAATQTITNQFDVFVPELKYLDESDYDVTGYTKSLTRAWSAVAVPGTVTGTAALFDIVYSSSYYDAAYAITLAATIVYTSVTYAYLTIKEKLTISESADAYTPPTADELLGYLTTLKTRMDALRNNCEEYDEAKAAYQYAYSLYNHFFKRICSDDTIGAYTYIQEILDILHHHQSITTTHLNTPLTVFEYDCGTSSPDPYDWIVGAATSATKPLKAGDTSVTLPLAFSGFNISFIRGNLTQYTTDVGDGTSYYTWNKTTRLLTISPAAALDEIFRIHPSR